MAIGRPITLTPNISSKNISIAATEGQTEFTVTGGYRINDLAVYRNGVRLVDGRDFSATDGQTVTVISDSVIADDVLEFSVIDNFNVAGVIVGAASSQTLNGNLHITGEFYTGTFSPDQLNVSGVSTLSTLKVGTAITAQSGIVTATGIDAAVAVWTLGASGTNHYTFTGPGNLSSTTDPTLNLIRGQKYVFQNRSGGHPFRIQSTINGSAGTAYNTGVTNNDGGDGTNIIFDVPYNAPNVLYYQCTSHGNMGGAMYIDGSAYEISVGSGITFGSAGVSTFSGTADVHLLDNVQLNVGDGSDLAIYHDGTSSYIKNTTNDLVIWDDSRVRVRTPSLLVNNAANDENLLVATENGSVDLYYNNSKKFETTNDGTVTTGIATVTQGLNTDGILSEKFETVANKLSAAPNIDLEDGMVHYFTTTETTTATPNIRYSSTKTLNNMLSTGDAITVTIITTAAAAGYSANWEIDGTGITEEWIGGSAPSEGGSNGYDIYTANILKTGNAAWKVFINLVNAT